MEKLRKEGSPSNWGVSNWGRPEYDIRLLEHVFGKEEQAQAHKLGLQYLYRFETRLTVGGTPLRGSYVLDEVFSPTFSIARDRFCKAAGDAGALLEELDLDVSGPDDEALIIVHGINAYGMAYLRRCNENNVDLNRNCLGPSEQYEGAPDGYHKLNALLNPETPPASLDPFLLRLPWYVVRYGFRNLKQAVAGGQYHYPRGLFFGGNGLEQGPRLLLNWLKRNLDGVERICAIDVHTGLGQHGVDSLLVSYEASTERFDQLQWRLGQNIIAHDPGSVSYRAIGSLLEALEREMPKIKWSCIVQEFGTMSVLQVLRALREENRQHHYGRNQHLDHPAKRRLLQVFWPDDANWRHEVLRRGRELTTKVAAIAFAW